MNGNVQLIRTMIIEKFLTDCLFLLSWNLIPIRQCSSKTSNNNKRFQSSFSKNWTCTGICTCTKFCIKFVTSYIFTCFFKLFVIMSCFLPTPSTFCQLLLNMFSTFWNLISTFYLLLLIRNPIFLLNIVPFLKKHFFSREICHHKYLYENNRISLLSHHIYYLERNKLNWNRKMSVICRLSSLNVISIVTLENHYIFTKLYY